MLGRGNVNYLKALAARHFEDNLKSGTNTTTSPILYCFNSPTECDKHTLQENDHARSFSTCMASGIACRCPSKSLSLSQLMLMSSEAKSVLVGPPAPEASLSPPSAARESVTQHGTSSAPGLQPEAQSCTTAFEYGRVQGYGQG